MNDIYIRERVAVAVKSAARTLDLLELLSGRRHGMSLADISHTLRIPKSSAFQILRTLEAREYVARDRVTNRFSLDVGVFALGQAYAEGMDVVREGQRIVAEFARAPDETCHLAILDGLDGIYVAKEESGQPMRMVSAVGRRLPAHATGVGKMLLAMLDERTLARRLKGARLIRLTPQTIVTIPRLREELRVTRDRWFAFDRGESTEGLHCVAAPVLDQSGGCVAAISASVPLVRLPAERIPEVLVRVCRAARDLSRALGYRGRYQGALAADRAQLSALARGAGALSTSRLSAVRR